MIHHTDYHVGLLRGFLKANHADPEFLHALDVLLTSKRAAGELIGAQSPAEQFEALRQAATIKGKPK